MEIYTNKHTQIRKDSKNTKTQTHTHTLSHTNTHTHTHSHSNTCYRLINTQTTQTHTLTYSHRHTQTQTHTEIHKKGYFPCDGALRSVLAPGKRRARLLVACLHKHYYFIKTSNYFSFSLPILRPGHLYMRWTWITQDHNAYIIQHHTMCIV